MIAAHELDLSITKIAPLLAISESGYRKWKSQDPKENDPQLMATT